MCSKHCSNYKKKTTYTMHFNNFKLNMHLLFILLPSPLQWLYINLERNLNLVF